MIENLGSAILILGVLYLYLAYGLNFWVALILVLFGLGLWCYPSANNLKKELLKSKIDLNKEKAGYYARKNKVGVGI